ncbi:MAG TPA: hypothetical protein DDY31_03495, partial [Lachnospiraceae bacterium]|nr:hypothetical protein [Lachnospiraceae bacterium]
MGINSKMRFYRNIRSKQKKDYLGKKFDSMSIQVLISTMDQEDASFLKQMNLQTDAIVGNQNGCDKEVMLLDNGNKIKFICSKEKGLANNRNLTLSKADACICILADDDIQYVNGYAKTIKNAYEKYPDADVIIFNLYEKPQKR